jgi:hypothetical protein
MHSLLRRRLVRDWNLFHRVRATECYLLRDVFCVPSDGTYPLRARLCLLRGTANDLSLGRTEER